jgi:hypothetical protein
VIRRLLVPVLLVAMIAFGWFVYSTLSAHRSRVVTTSAEAPSHTKSMIKLPGTIIVAQQGTLYRFQDGTFTPIAQGGWVQPAVNPAHSQLVAAKRGADVSDLYLMDTDGHVLRQLTRDTSRVTQLNHWAFYPSFSPDGKTIFYSYDPKDPNNAFRVDLAVYAQPLSRPQAQARRWTTPNFFTGGDIQPVPLGSTGPLLYSKFDIDKAGKLFSQLWLQSRPGVPGRALTAPADDCSQPAMSPDGTRLAMICASGQQTTRLEVASFNGIRLGPPQVLVEGTPADPAWSPDGNSLVYYSPVAPSGHFQLFSVNVPASPAPSPPARVGQKAAPPPSAAPPKPVQVTTDNDFDTTSAPVWFPSRDANRRAPQ